VQDGGKEILDLIGEDEILRRKGGCRRTLTQTQPDAGTYAGHITFMKEL
jgi:hypothetical protein